MNRLKIGCLCIMISLFAAGLQAAPVTWDVGPAGATGSYSIPLGGNGGQFGTLTSPPYSNTQDGGPQSSSEESERSGYRHHDRKFWIESRTHRILCHGGRWNHDDGVLNQVEARITKTAMDGNQYIYNGIQTITTSVARSFSADPGADVTVSATITGLIDWIDDPRVQLGLVVTRLTPLRPMPVIE